MAANSKSWQMGFRCAGAVCLSVVMLGVILGWKSGYRDFRFALALGVGAVLFAFEFFLAAPRLLEKFRRTFAHLTPVVATVVPLFAFLIYSLFPHRDWLWILAGVTYVLAPVLLLAGAAGKRAGLPQDYLALLLVWLPVQFRWVYRLFPYPPPLTHILTILFALCTGIAAFVVIRQLEGIGYAIEWRPGFAWQFVFNSIAFGLIAITLGIKIGFLSYAPSLQRIHSLPITTLGILLFTAWPEEFLFRGVMQNLLSRTCRNQWIGLVIASIIFGFAHILHAPFPNWKYVLLATIAGLFYGHAWMKTGSLVPGALVHGFVDITWHVLFR
jgi:membrane protease YdiL (CAAX protease family)